MGSLKTFFLNTLAGGLLSLGCGPLAAMSPDDQVRFFAQCAGRLSAQMEFQWLFDGAASERTKAARKSAIDILEAMIPPEIAPDKGRQVLHWRIEAKQAQAVLLSQGTFQTDTRRARMAAALALRQINECRAALIS